jgi:hypothetical protein
MPPRGMSGAVRATLSSMSAVPMFEERWGSPGEPPLDPWEPLHPPKSSISDFLELSPHVNQAEWYATWSQTSPVSRGCTAFGLMASAAPGKVSEDAPPALVTTSKRGPTRMAAAVFDGMGGAGSSPFQLRSGQVVTQAFAASPLSEDKSVTSGGCK